MPRAALTGSVTEGSVTEESVTEGSVTEGSGSGTMEGTTLTGGAPGSASTAPAVKRLDTQMACAKRKPPSALTISSYRIPCGSRYA